MNSSHPNVIKCLNYWPDFCYINVSSDGGSQSFCSELCIILWTTTLIFSCFRYARAIWHSWPGRVITLLKSFHFGEILKQIIRYKAGVTYGGDSQVLICYSDSTTLAVVFTCASNISSASKMLTFTISLILWFSMRRSIQSFCSKKCTNTQLLPTVLSSRSPNFFFNPASWLFVIYV